MARDVNGVYSQDRRLMNFARQLGSLPEAYIALSVCPSMDVEKEVFKYYVFSRDDERAPGNTLRGPASPAHMVDFGLSTATGTAFEYALETELSEEEVEWSDGALSPEEDATISLNRQKALDTEIRFRDEIDATGDHAASHSTTLAGTSQWSDYSNSTPLSDVSTGVTQIISATGRRPTHGWMSYEVFVKLQYHPDILNAIKYTGVGVATLDHMKTLFQVPNLFVGEAVYNSAKEGQTDVSAFVWGKDFFLGVVGQTLGRRDFTFGRHASRPVVKSGGQRDVTERTENDRNLTRCVRRRYSDTFLDVGMAVGGTYMIENAVA